MRSALLFGSSLLSLLAAQPAVGQAAVSPPPEAGAEQDQSETGLSENDQIVVTATRIAGQVDAPQPPIITLNEDEIAAYGASSIQDLLSALAPQTGSGRGRASGPPVILLNGMRVSNFREMRNFTPEAIKRVEVLPEEVALRYGFPAEQRVINFILKDNFVGRAVELEYGQPWAGGSSSKQAEASLLRIQGPNRFNLRVEANDTSPLTESERTIIQTSGSVPTVTTDPDPAAFRTLIADTRSFDLNTSWATGLGEKGQGGSLSFSGGINVADSRSMSGLNLVQLTAPGGATALRSLPGALETSNRAITAVGGGGFNTSFGLWQFGATIDYTHAESITLIDRRVDTSALVTAAAAGTLPVTGPLPALAPAGFDRVANNSERIESLLTLSGQPFRVPAGPAALTVKAGTTWVDFASEDARSIVGPVSLNRFRVQGGVNLAIPLTSRREQFGAGLGDLNLNLSANLSHVSDFGAINDWSVGLTWGLTEKLSLQASYIANQEAPGISQLGNPAVQSFNVPVYDFTRSETVLVTITSGGNPLLKQEEQRDLKFSANWQLPFLSNSSLVVEYFRNRSENVTAAFPLLTPAIEAAYPGRVTRDPTGRLTAIDRRPITLARQEGERLRWGLNLSGTVGKAAPAAPGGGMMGGMRPGGGGAGGGRPPGAGGPPAGGGPGRGPGGGMGGGPMMGMFGGGGGQGRWNLGLYHTIRFKEQVLVTPGGAVLDLLDGDALSGGGVARHAVELDSGLFYRGIGLRLAGRYTAPTRIRASGLPGSSDLEFGGLLGFDLRLFLNFDQRQQLIKDVPALKGVRLSLRIDNLFDSRQRVTDGTGTVPLSYQPDYLDARGRYIAVELRKQF